MHNVAFFHFISFVIGTGELLHNLPADCMNLNVDCSSQSGLYKNVSLQANDLFHHKKKLMYHKQITN
jgi:hypothetical protein